MPLQQYDDQYRRPIVRKKSSKNRADKQLFQKYKITRQQLDIILTELCQKYEQNWVTISAALYQQHGIVLNSAIIKQRYGMFLDPKLRKDGFTRKEQMSIVKMFCLDGASCKDFSKVFPNRQRLMFKNVLHMEFRKAYYKLQNYLEQEIKKLPPNEVIRTEQENVQMVIRAVASQTNFQWKSNIAGYKVLYFFVVTDVQKLDQMPKEVALLLYRRMLEVTKQMKIQRLRHYNKIDPQYHNYRAEYIKNRKISKRKGSASQTSSEAYKDSNQSSVEVKRQQVQMNTETDSIANLSMNKLALGHNQGDYSSSNVQYSDVLQGMDQQLQSDHFLDEQLDIQFD